MKKLFLLVMVLAFQISTMQAQNFFKRPYNTNDTVRHGFTKESDRAQYGESDYSNVVRVERGISLKEAFDIAESDPEVDYFVYLKGECMVLCTSPDVDVNNDPFNLITQEQFIYDSGKLGFGFIRVFHYGDTVFFKKDGMQLGTAYGLADTYHKKQ